ncbi:MAG: tetratricopeptide repeat-containing serine/threonine-protein kinase [Candidatus Eremiobacteraeota bacterium]|nr:tetratricopeptide repeat-containing serine/threonine-protein kinase [Candidatus Eremiobacteraeota bacterium]
MLIGSELPVSFGNDPQHRYRVERILGAGGMATVYLATDLHDDRQVALKVLHEHLDPLEGAARFAREVAILARLAHPHIVPLLDSGVTAGQPWYAMPYVEGESLRARLQREGRLPVAETLAIAGQVSDALDHAKAQGVVHRDVKPENILLGAHVLVADFGIARVVARTWNDAPTLTAVGTVVGTIDYAAPEQLFGEAVDARADLYALACVVWEMLTGRSPFHGGSMQQSIARRLMGAPPAFEPPREEAEPLLTVLRDALRPDPAERPESCGDFVERLRQATAATSGTDARVAVKVSDQAIPTLAVLPFAVAGGDAESEILAEGIAEELLLALGRIPGFRVASRAASFAFRGGNLDLQRVAERLHVEAAVCGTLRRAGDQIRVTVELLDLRTGHQRWANRYDRELRDVFAVQEQIARAVATELQGRLDAAPRVSIRSRHSADLQAYADYLRGRHFWNRRPRQTRQGLECYERAVARDPSYALAWAGIADCWATLGSWEAGEVEPEEAFRRAADAAHRAIALNPALAEPLAALAYAEFHFGGASMDATRAMDRALALDRGYAHAHHWHSHLLLPLGHVQESLEASLRALRLEPLDTVLNVHLAWHHHFAGQYHAAVEQGERTIALDPDDFWGFFFQALSHEQLGDPGTALRCLDDAARRAGDLTVIRSARAHALASSGEAVRARAVLRELDALATHRYVSPYERALIHLALGEHEPAVARLWEARERHDGWLPYARVDPRLRPFLLTPEVAAVLQPR